MMLMASPSGLSDKRKQAMVAGRASAFEQRHGKLRGSAARGGRGRCAGRAGGFTLIELLVVIAMICLLLAIFLPSLRQVREQARAAICLSHLKQWGTTFALFLEDKDGRQKVIQAGTHEPQGDSYRYVVRNIE